MMMIKTTTLSPWAILFLTLTVLELLMLSVFNGRLGLYWSPVVWLIAAVGSTIIFVREQGFGRKPFTLTQSNGQNANIAWIIFAVGSIISAILLSRIFNAFEVKPQSSDIIPSLWLYVQRWFAGTDPYAPMEFPGWVVIPNYLPLRWMPFGLAEWLHIDFRWIGFLAISSVFLVYTYYLTKQTIGRLEVGIKALAPWVFLITFLVKDKPAFGNAVETLIAAYYLILAFSLFRSPLWVAFGISLCLLSRFSFTFWLPAYGIMFMMQNGWKQSFQVAGLVLLAVSAFFIIPFAWHDAGKTFLEGLQYYDKCALGEWYRQSWQEPGAIPVHLSRGLGFAYFFYKGEGTELAQYALAKNFHQMICFATAALTILGFYFLKKRGVDPKVYGVASLKIYLTIFYGFFPVPYHYLFEVPFFLSLVMLFYYWLGKNELNATK